MTMLMRLLREPLLHFLLIGAAIFGAYGYLGGEPPPEANEIVITPERIARIEAAFEAAWKRPPEPDELEVLIEEDIREEVYYREAVALGLDRDDAVIRRRLRLKMEFLIDTTAQLIEPTEQELAAFYEENLDDYRLPPKIAFEQVYLGEAPSPRQAEVVLARLRGGPNSGSGSLGERTLLPPALDLSLPNAVDGSFGAGFFERLAPLEVGVWSGPVRSAYGLHLVRVRARTPGAAAPLVEVANEVRRNWRMGKAQEIRDRDYAERRRSYAITVRRGEAASEPAR